MAHLSFSLHLIIFLLIRPSSARVIPMASADLINKVCQSNLNPPACVQLFNSVPETKTADLAGLGRISLNLAQHLVSETLDYISYLDGKTTDQRLHDIFKTCNKWYDFAKTAVDTAMKDLNDGAYTPMNENSWGAGEAALTCEEEFENAPSRPSPLSDRNDLMYRLGQMATAISNMLQDPTPPAE
ncbi:pectinesterase inhibitor [Magnolia sinica]|uniref:pectinesterase inhibitor n=1 Tax=Magnolia sinica TaxID=86752 RepID=UPI00265A804E|nr:pectinesterase inhibitor [Magnolia sinica]